MTIPPSSPVPTAEEFARIDSSARPNAADPAPGRESWRARTIRAQLVRGVTTVGMLTVLAKLAMAGRDVALATRFGTRGEVDAFVVALAVPMFAMQVLAGSLPYSFIPTYTIAGAQEGDAVAAQLVGTVLALNVVVVGAGTLLLVVAAPLLLPLIGSGFDASKLALTQSLFFELLPMLAFSALSVVWAAVLNVHHRYALAALTPALAPLVATVMLLMTDAPGGIHAVAWGMSLGSAIEAVLLAYALHRRGVSPIPRWGGLDEHVRHVLRQYAPAVGAALLMSSTVLVDQAVAASQGSGSVSTLNFGGKVVGFVLGVGAVALGTVVLPNMSASAAREDWALIRKTLRAYVGAVAVVTVPLTIFVIVASKPIVTLLFDHGAFTAHDVHEVAAVQALYAIQIPFYLLCIVIVRTLSALRKNHVFIAMALGMVVMNVMTDIAFVHLWGIPGIALSTSLVYALACGTVFVVLERVLRTEERRS